MKVIEGNGDLPTGMTRNQVSLGIRPPLAALATDGFRRATTPWPIALMVDIIISYHGHPFRHMQHSFLRASRGIFIIIAKNPSPDGDAVRNGSRSSVQLNYFTQISYVAKGIAAISGR